MSEMDGIIGTRFDPRVDPRQDKEAERARKEVELLVRDVVKRTGVIADSAKGIVDRFEKLWPEVHQLQDRVKKQEVLLMQLARLLGDPKLRAQVTRSLVSTVKSKEKRELMRLAKNGVATAGIERCSDGSGDFSVDGGKPIRLPPAVADLGSLLISGNPKAEGSDRKAGWWKFDDLTRALGALLLGREVAGQAPRDRLKTDLATLVVKSPGPRASAGMKGFANGEATKTKKTRGALRQLIYRLRDHLKAGGVNPWIVQVSRGRVRLVLRRGDQGGDAADGV